jgi:5-methylcytosine-specific restriction endonuclease McrA
MGQNYIDARYNTLFKLYLDKCSKVSRIKDDLTWLEKYPDLLEKYPDYPNQQLLRKLEIETDDIREALHNRYYPEYSHKIFQSMPYHDYLQTEHWEHVRKWALQRANYKCQMDAKHKGSLHVHHNTYENMGAEKDADVIVLCEDCHRKHHNKEMVS